MGFFKKIISAPVELVKDVYTGSKDIIEDVYTGGKDVVTDVYGGVESAFSTTGDATKKVIGGTWNAVEETAETIGAEGVIGYSVGGGPGLVAGSYLKQQKESQESILEQQRALAGLGLSGSEIAYLQATTPQVGNPLEFYFNPGTITRQPVSREPGLSSPRYVLNETEPKQPATNLMPLILLGVGAVVLFGVLKR